MRVWRWEAELMARMMSRFPSMVTWTVTLQRGGAAV